jgi:hypothetical protein
LTGVAAETAARRLAGEQPSRMRALLAASVAALGTGVVVYKLLRSGGNAEDDG